MLFIGDIEVWYKSHYKKFGNFYRSEKVLKMVEKSNIYIYIYIVQYKNDESNSYNFLQDI